MLVLSFKPGETLWFTHSDDGDLPAGPPIGRAVIEEIRGSQVRIAFDFPQEVRMMRDKLYKEKLAEKKTGKRRVRK